MCFADTGSTNILQQTTLRFSQNVAVAKVYKVQSKVLALFL